MINAATNMSSKIKWVVWTSVVICLAYLCYRDRVNWYYEFSKSEKDYAELAIADCRFHLRYFPDSWKCHRDLAYFLSRSATVTFDKPKRQALLREAIAEYKEAIRRNPSDPVMYRDLGDIYDAALEDH